MITDWQTLTPAQYSDALYKFLVTVETENHKHADYAAYPDSRGFLSIGVGFNLTVASVRSAVFAQFRLVTNDPALSATQYASLNATENKYIADLLTAIKNDDAATFNSTLQNRASNKDLTLVLGSLPSALTDATSQAAFNVLVGTSTDSAGAGTYESLVNKWLAGIPPSSERIALVSLAYNSRTSPTTGLPTTLGANLLAAVQSGNRAEAWYEIRYGTNPPAVDSGGIAKRRYYESQAFGLFAAPGQPTLQEAMQAYETLNQHRSTIFNYEVQYGTDPDAAANNKGLSPGGRDKQANFDYGLTGTAFQVQTLAALLGTAASGGKSAEQLLADSIQSESPLLADLGAGLASFARPTDIFVASSSDPMANAASGDSSTTSGVSESSNNHILIGTGGGQSLVGGLGNDILVAGPGSEELTSGMGSDTIIAGGGTDTVNLRGTVAAVDFEFQGQTGFHEIINADSSPIGAIEVGGVQIIGSTAVPVLSTNVATNGTDLTWTDGTGGAYTYIGSSGLSVGKNGCSIKRRGLFS
jgi:hypothetical protein